MTEDFFLANFQFRFCLCILQQVIAMPNMNGKNWDPDKNMTNHFYIYVHHLPRPTETDLLRQKGSSLVKQSSKLTGSAKSEASEIWVRTSEPILVLVRSD